MDIANVLAERETTHGDFTDVARVTKGIQGAFRASPNWNRLNAVQGLALDMIAMKAARALCGDPSEPDHWADLAGYAQLVVDRISRE